MPAFDEFSFAVRLAARTLASNGSSSMATVCAGSMALVMAGVPIRAPVAGISVGLLAERWPKPRPMLWQSGDNAGDGSSGHFVHGAVSVDGADGVDGPPYGRCALLLDIQGMEDALGDMDMKVAGTRAGLTALQLDTKLPGLPLEVLTGAVALARQAHSQLLDSMDAAVADAQSAQQATGGGGPQHKPLKINADLVPALVGEGGRSIEALQERSRAAVSLRPDGEVQLYAPDDASMRMALAGVQAVEGTDLEPGRAYWARVVELLDFGAVVELASGARHLLPISEVSHTRLRDIRDVLTERQVIRVLCRGLDRRGLLSLSHKALLPVPHGSSSGGDAGKGGTQGDLGGRAPPPRHVQHTDGAATNDAQRARGAADAAPQSGLGRHHAPPKAPLNSGRGHRQ